MNNKEIYQEVENKVKETVDKLNKKFNFDMKYPHIYYDITGNNGGLAKSASMTVHYNDKLLKQNKDSFIENVIPHEVCHIAVFHLYQTKNKPYPKNGHGADWQIMMRVVGVNARQFHQYEVEKKQPVEYKYDCGCAEGIVVPQRIHKKIKNTPMVCKKCTKQLINGERIIKIGFKNPSPNGSTEIRDN